MKIDCPNYTQVPNIVLDSMHEFTHVEFKVVMLICRFTFGFHRKSHSLSYSFIENGCGLHCNSVTNAIHSLIHKGIITRSQFGDSFKYSLNVEGVATLPDSPDYPVVCPTLPDSPVATLPDSPKKEIEKETLKKGAFVKPTLEAVKLQSAKIGLSDFEAEKFFNYYESNGWRVGKNPMRSWPHSLAGWKSRANAYQPAHKQIISRNTGTYNDHPVDPSLLSKVR